MTLSAILMALVAARYFLPSMPGAFEQQKDFYPTVRPVLLAHIAGGIIAVVAGPWQFWSWLRTHHVRWHRRIGKTYLFGTLIGVPAALYLAQFAHGGFVTHAGFTGMALVWGWATGAAYVRIRAGRIDQHREWMTRSYAVVFGFVMLRLWIPALMSFGIPFDEVYQTVSWLCWVPNLLLAELYLGWRRNQRVSVVAPAAA